MIIIIKHQEKKKWYGLISIQTSDTILKRFKCYLEDEQELWVAHTRPGSEKKQQTYVVTKWRLETSES